jgi:hypothetical protein
MAGHGAARRVRQHLLTEVLIQIAAAYETQLRRKRNQLTFDDNVEIGRAIRSVFDSRPVNLSAMCSISVGEVMNKNSQLKKPAPI